MGNITQNKPATASNSFAPFLPARAVDGVISPANRWVSPQVPAWLAVDLQNNYWVNQWTANFMGYVGWAPSYNIKNFKLQGSADNVNWFDMDIVSNNSVNQINRLVTPKIARFLRVNISNGLSINDGVASIVDFQAFEPETAPFLSSLVPSVGPFSTAFGRRNFNYSIYVANSVNTIVFTPTAAQTNMEIKVNGTVVASGVPSSQIPLTVGNNAIPITVKSADGTMLTTYAINVTRAGNASYLKSLSLIEDNLELPVILSPTFQSNLLNYTATVDADYSSVKVTPSTDDATVTIKVNGMVVQSGAQSGSIGLNIGSNTITIDLSSSGGGHNIYYVVITKTA